MRGQGTFEYILLLGGAILVTSLSLFILTSSQPQIDDAKQCAIAARSTIDCFYADGTFRNDSSFQFNGKPAYCNCSWYGTTTALAATPTPIPQCKGEGQNCGGIIGSGSCCQGLTCNNPLPGVEGTCKLVPMDCQNTQDSCGLGGICKKCGDNEECVANVCTLKTGCQYNNPPCAADQVCRNNVCGPKDDIALIVSDSAVLEPQGGLQFAGTITAKEQAVENMIKSYAGRGVTRIPAKDATLDNLKKFKAIVETDYYAQVQGATIDALLDAGVNVLLFHDAMKTIKPDASTETIDGTIGINSNTRFLVKYDAGGCGGNKITVQNPSATHYYTSGIGGWTALTEAFCAWRYNTFTKETASAKGAAFGYDPSAFTDEGRIMADQMLRWALGISSPSKTVPKGSVALITKDYSENPVLTEQEQALKTLYGKLGETIYLVPQKDRFTAEFKDAKYVTTAHAPGFKLANYYQWLTGERPSIISYQATGLFVDAGTEKFSDAGMGMEIGVNNKKNFLDKYDAGGCGSNKVTIGDDNTRAYYFAGGIGGWEALAEARCAWRYDAFTKETASAKSAVFGYDPAGFNDEGKIMFEQVVRWVIGNTTMTTFQPNTVALITKSYALNPPLTLEEQAASDLLKKQGLAVAQVSQRKRFTTDFGSAKFLMIVHPPTFRLNGFYQGLTDSKQMLVLYEGMKLLVDAQTEQIDGTIGINSNTRFLGKYDAGGCGGNKITVQNPSATHYYTSGIGGWTALTEAFCARRYNTFTKDATKSIAFGYNPAQLNDEGKIMFEQIVRWMVDNQTQNDVPANSVAFITKSYDGSALTDEETAAKALLEKEGLQVKLVPQNNRFTTDFGKAKMIATAHWPGFKIAGFYQGVSDAKMTLLLHEAMRLVSDANPEQYGEVGINLNTRFLGKYDAGGCGGNKITVQNPSATHYYTSGIGGWTALTEAFCARRYNTFTKDATKSIAFGYNPAQLNEEGKIMFEEMVRWQTDNTSFAYTVPAGTAALLASGYADSPALTPEEQATKAKLEQMGLAVKVVPQKYRFNLDASKAAFTAMAEYPGFNINSIISLNAQIPRLMLVYSGLNLPKTASIREGQTSMYIHQNKAFLAPYATGVHTKYQEQSRTYQQGGIGGWDTIGETSSWNWAYSAFYRQPAQGVCGAAWGFDPKALNDKGKLLFGNIARWLYHGCYLPSQGKTSSETVSEAHPYCFRNTGLPNNQYGTSCGGGACDNTAYINIPSGINSYVYRIELVKYTMDDTGTVQLNGNTLVNKDVCSYNQNTPCNGGPQSVPGKECKGGCEWTGSGWGPYMTTPENGCARPPAYHDIPMGLLHEGQNALYVKANDCICGENKAEAVVRVYTRTAP